MPSPIPSIPPDFVSDGCTGFFDVWRGIILRYCCEAHDLAWYLHPGDWLVWIASNIELARCFWQAGAWEVAIGGLIATCTIGALLFGGVIRKWGSRAPPTAQPRSGGAFLFQQQERTSMISKADIHKLCPSASPALVGAILSLWHIAEGAGINTPLRVRHFFARVAVETGGLRFVEESLTYSSIARIRAVWPTRFKTDAAAAPYVRNPKKLAIKVYGGRLGNAPAPSTDGWDYRGGGMLQTTGRDNYRAMGFEDNPEELRDPEIAFQTAVTEWVRRGCNELADNDDVEAICKAINGGRNGLADQRAYLKKAEGIWPDDADMADDTPEANDVLVGAIQSALIQKGYHEVGEPDGDFGRRTRGAILAFEADHALPLTGRPTPAILASILASDARPVAAERAEGKPVEHPAVKDAGPLRAIGVALGGGSALSMAEPIVDKIEGGAALVARLKTALEPIIYLWPIFAVAAAVAVVYFATRARKAVVEDYRSGRLSR